MIAPAAAPQKPGTRTPGVTAKEPRLRLLSFIVPAPDFFATPQEIHRAVQDEMTSFRAEWEILFIDHGRCERTWLHIQELRRADPGHVRAFIFSETQNRSAALALGYREAKGELVFSLESDQRDDPRQLPQFLERIGWEQDLSPRPKPSDPAERWQNILPRGVLRGETLSSVRAA